MAIALGALRNRGNLPLWQATHPGDEQGRVTIFGLTGDPIGTL